MASMAQQMKRNRKKRKSKAGYVAPTEEGQKGIHFKEGGLHGSTGTPKAKKIPAAEHAAARKGSLGKKAQKQELFYENVLTGGRR